MTLTAKLEAAVDAKYDVRERLVRLTEAREWLDDAEREAVRDARAQDVSWTEIGLLVGISKQTAWDRWQRGWRNPGGGTFSEVDR